MMTRVMADSPAGLLRLDEHLLPWYNTPVMMLDMKQTLLLCLGAWALNAAALQGQGCALINACRWRLEPAVMSPGWAAAGLWR